MLPFIDLNAQFTRLEKDIRARIDAVLAHGQYVMGPEIAELEAQLAAFAGVRHCIGCASGTDALFMALLAHGIGPGDAIFTTPFTFIATAEVISLCGATPIFVDIDPKTYNIDPDKLQRAVTALQENDPAIYPLPRNAEHRTLHGEPAVTAKAVITVDLFGLPCDYDRINAIAQKEGLHVIEDAAQGFGGVYRGKRACSCGTIGCTSFFPAKPLGCYGDGGAVFTDDNMIADILRSILIHGKGEDKYENVRIGLNARLDTLQAAILLPKLAVFPEELRQRQRVADEYTERLSDLGSLVTPPSVPEGYESAWAQYSVLSDRRTDIQKGLQEEGIPTAIYYPKPLHLQTAFSFLGYHKGDMPVSEACAARIFSLPMHPYLKTREIDRICACIKKIIEK